MINILFLSSFSGKSFVELFTLYPELLEIINPILLTDNPDSLAISFCKRLNLTCVVVEKVGKNRSLLFETIQKHAYSDVAGIYMFGFRWIIPESILAVYKNILFNLHPSPLTVKGKNPQKRYFEMCQQQLSRSSSSALIVPGNTIHRVTAKVDTGTVLLTDILLIYKNQKLSTFIEQLRRNAVVLTYQFLLYGLEFNLFRR